MQSTGHSSTHERSITSMQGSLMAYGMTGSLVRGDRLSPQRIEGAAAVAAGERQLAHGATEGALTPERAALVSGVNLARWAADVGLGSVLRVGRGEGQTGGREKESVLATAFEAVLAVIYLEGGLEAARRTVAALAVW